MDKYPSKTEFQKYEQVHRDGRTNMCDLAMVAKLSGLKKQVICDIIDNYEDLANIYHMADDADD